MRRQTPIAHLLYSHLFPQPTPTDPPSFSAHLARNLVPEVRIEVATFYGDLNSAEARYPGLNYCHPPHRMRLGRFKHHKRLFHAFDTLGLTYTEIQDFCCWEGTKWARERYEHDENVKVLDTTGDEIGPFVDHRERRASSEQVRRHSITRKTDISIIVEDASTSSSNSSNRQPPIQEDDAEINDVASDDEHEEVDHDPETEQESPMEALARQQHIVEVQTRRADSIFQRLNRDARMYQHILDTFRAGQDLTPEMEQYLKEQSEHGEQLNVSGAVAQRQLQRVAASGSAVGTSSNTRTAAA